MKKLKAKKNQDLRVPQLNASRTSLLTQRIHLDVISSLARNRKWVFSGIKQSILHLEKEKTFCFSRIEINVRHKDQTVTKEVKSKENKKINWKIDLEVKEQKDAFQIELKVYSLQDPHHKTSNYHITKLWIKCHTNAAATESLYATCGKRRAEEIKNG